jgi:hypothetical protein
VTIAAAELLVVYVTGALGIGNPLPSRTETERLRVSPIAVIGSVPLNVSCMVVATGTSVTVGGVASEPLEHAAANTMSSATEERVTIDMVSQEMAIDRAVV